MGWSWAGWERRLRLRSGLLGSGHRGTAGLDSLRGSPALWTCPCGDHGIHVLHTASTPAPWCCGPTPRWGSYLGHRFLLRLLRLPHERQLRFPPHLLEVEAQQGQRLWAGSTLGTALTTSPSQLFPSTSPADGDDAASAWHAASAALKQPGCSSP